MDNYYKDRLTERKIEAKERLITNKEKLDSLTYDNLMRGLISSVKEEVESSVARVLQIFTK